jgi:NAD(P)-dependent dehydrogenase (short-subunit alcohol dehydrogenase family)
MNVSQESSVTKGFEVLEQRGEKIDICVNSAGIFKSTPLLEHDNHDSFEETMRVNVMGTWNVIKSVALHMKHHKIQGSIITIGSTNGAHRLRENLGAYASSKAAVHQMKKALVGELSPYNIRINCISPGLFHTPLTDFKLQTEEMRENIGKLIPLGFVGNPKDLNGLCSPQRKHLFI